MRRGFFSGERIFPPAQSSSLPPQISGQDVIKRMVFCFSKTRHNLDQERDYFDPEVFTLFRSSHMAEKKPAAFTNCQIASPIKIPALQHIPRPVESMRPSNLGRERWNPISSFIVPEPRVRRLD